MQKSPLHNHHRAGTPAYFQAYRHRRKQGLPLYLLRDQSRITLLNSIIRQISRFFQLDVYTYACVERKRLLYLIFKFRFLFLLANKSFFPARRIRIRLHREKMFSSSKISRSGIEVFLLEDKEFFRFDVYTTPTSQF